MDTSTLKQILCEEMSLYAGEGFNVVGYLTVDEEAELYVIIDYAKIRGKQVIAPTLIARLRDDSIVIELDHNLKLLKDALKVRGVPENQIVLAYCEAAIEAREKSFVWKVLAKQLPLSPCG